MNANNIPLLLLAFPERDEDGRTGLAAKSSAKILYFIIFCFVYNKRISANISFCWSLMVTHAQLLLLAFESF